jgi:hypothetical protein
MSQQRSPTSLEGYISNYTSIVPLVDVDSDNDVESPRSSPTLNLSTTSYSSLTGPTDKKLRIKSSKVIGDATKIRPLPRPPLPPLPPLPPAPPPLLELNLLDQRYGSRSSSGGNRISAVADQTADDPFFGCHFFFLGCQYSSYDRNAWKTHCLRHLGSKPLPKTATCLLCPAEFNHALGTIAWDDMLEHMADHLIEGDSTVTAQPDLPLLNYLREQNIINDIDYQKLRINYQLQSGPSCPGVDIGGGRVKRHLSAYVQPQGSKRTPEGEAIIQLLPTPVGYKKNAF